MAMCYRLSGLVSAVMMVGALVLASCSSTPTSPVTSVGSTTATKPYGSLTIGYYLSSSQSITPGEGNVFGMLGSAIFDKLVDLTPEGKQTPGIAERWETSPDGKTHTFYIRKGVKFQDGSDLTGADVKFSMERAMKPDIVVFTTVWNGLVDSIELKDEYTVAVHLKKPSYNPLLGIGDLQGGPAAVVPKKYIEEKGEDYFKKNLMGSGSWKVLTYRFNDILELEAVESHWRAVPKFKNITLLYVLEEATRVAMLKTGELDIGVITPDSAPGLKAAGLRIMAHEGGSQYFMWPIYDPEKPAMVPFGDIRVRQALSLAIDRKELGDKIYGGYATPGVVTNVPRSADFWDSNVLKPDPFDPERAKKLLAESGYVNGFDTTIYNTNPGAIANVTLGIGGYWRKIGIRATVDSREWSYVSTLLIPKRVPEMMGNSWGSASGGNYFGWSYVRSRYHTAANPFGQNVRNNPKVDALIDKVDSMPDSPERKRLQLEAVAMAKNDYNALSILNIQTLFAVGNKVGEFRPTEGASDAMGPSYETITHAK